jgi:glutaredoxin-related protein
MNYLKAVFWDYPEFTIEKNLKRFLRLKKSDSDM